MGNKCPKTIYEGRSWNVGDMECEACDDWHIANASAVKQCWKMNPKHLSEWKKAIRTEIYNLKKEARKFFSLEGVVRIRKSSSKKEEEK